MYIQYSAAPLSSAHSLFSLCTVETGPQKGLVSLQETVDNTADCTCDMGSSDLCVCVCAQVKEVVHDELFHAEKERGCNASIQVV